MLKIPLVLALCISATAALAQTRPASTAMNCGQAARLISSRGAVVLGTGGYTYDRFVADRSFCQATEITVSAFVPTRDNPQCFVGYRCKEPSRDDVFEDF
jgi:hypothetical protein